MSFKRDLPMSKLFQSFEVKIFIVGIIVGIILAFVTH